MTGAGLTYVQSTVSGAARNRSSAAAPDVASARYAAGKPSVSSRRVPSGASSEPAPPTNTTRASARDDYDAGVDAR
jgi:hypothetical protein